MDPKIRKGHETGKKFFMGDGDAGGIFSSS
jgi:hypothetical protein